MGVYLLARKYNLDYILEQNKHTVKQNIQYHAIFLQSLILYINIHNSCISYLEYQWLSLAGGTMGDLVFVLSPFPNFSLLLLQH